MLYATDAAVMKNISLTRIQQMASNPHINEDNLQLLYDVTSFIWTAKKQDEK
jgi:hypothetical protein